MILEAIKNSIDIRASITYVIYCLNRIISFMLAKIIVPILLTVKEQAEPVVEYISNQTTWMVPFAVITWYGPSGILIMLQCVFTFLLILFKLKKLLFN